MAPRERWRLQQEAEETARESLSIDPTRDYVKERDAWLEMELDGTNQRLFEACKAELLRTPSDWRGH